MKVFKESFEISKETLESLKNIEVEPAVIERIKKELKTDLRNYFNMPKDLIVNVTDLYEPRAEIIDSYIDRIGSLYDIISLCQVSLKNSKLGNRILVFNLSSYFNCHGLINGWCSCTKKCYAGRLEFRQFKKNIKNTIFYLYCKYSKKAELLELFELGVKKAVNKELTAVNTALYELQAIRFNEVGEIRDIIDLQFLNRFVRIFKNEVREGIKAYTYTTNPTINTYSSPSIVINKSLGYNLKPLDDEIIKTEAFKLTEIKTPEAMKEIRNSYTMIIKKPEDIKEVFNKYHEYKTISLCHGNCRSCKLCSKYNNIVVFIEHGNKSHESLKQEIAEAYEILESLKEGAEI